MNNERQNNDERFTLVELENGAIAVCDNEAPEKKKEVCIFRPRAHPFAKQAAEGVRDQMQAWSRANITIQPIDKLKPQRDPFVKGKFYEAPPPTLTVDEKRRYLAEVFSSSRGQQNACHVQHRERKGARMNYPFEKTKTGYPILDTEEKLQWFMNRLLHIEVDLYNVNAVVIDLDSVWLKRRETPCCQMLNVNGAEPSLIEPTIFAKVDPSVVPVLRAIHARRDAEMEQHRKELGEKERELRNKRIETEKEIKNTFCGLALSLLRTRKEQSND